MFWSCADEAGDVRSISAGRDERVPVAGAAGHPVETKSLRRAEAPGRHPGQLVTKQQLLEAVWPATFVSDAVLKDSIRQLREALGDDAASPRLHRDGASSRLPLHRSDLGSDLGNRHLPET